MSRRLLQLVVLVLVLVCGTVWADTVPVGNPDFSFPTITCVSFGYAYQAPGNCSTTTGGGNPYPQQDFNSALNGYWLFNVGDDGLTGNGTAFNPPDFTGQAFTQAAFLQGAGASVSQAITGPAGEWTVSFYLGSRQANNCCDGNQTVEVLLDSTVAGTYALTSFTPFTLETTSPVALSAGPHTLEFLGTADGDHTAFLSGVSVSSVPEANFYSYAAFFALGLSGLLVVVRRKRQA